MKLTMEGGDGLPIDGFYLIALKVIFKVRKMSNYGIRLHFGNFLKNGLITLFLFFSMRLLVMILNNCQEMDLIELFER